MGTVNIAYCRAMAGIAPVVYPPRATENITSSGTAASASGAPANGDIVVVTPKDADIAVKFGGTATATDFLIKSGTVREFGGFSGGETISVIEV